jgi:hypothetical protein
VIKKAIKSLIQPAPGTLAKMAKLTGALEKLMLLQTGAPANGQKNP